MFHPHPLHRAIVRYVQENPGCSKLAAAKIATRHPLRNPSKQYYLVNTCIRHGLIEAERLGNRYSLTVPSES